MRTEKKKRSFMLTASEADLVGVITGGRDMESRPLLNKMIAELSKIFNCSPADVVSMAVARMYISTQGHDQEYDYPSDEFKATMQYVDDGSPVIASKSVADLL